MENSVIERYQRHELTNVKFQHEKLQRRYERLYNILLQQGNKHDKIVLPPELVEIPVDFSEHSRVGLANYRLREHISKLEDMYIDNRPLSYYQRSLLIHKLYGVDLEEDVKLYYNMKL